jgi:hypothetical protein
LPQTPAAINAPISCNTSRSTNVLTQATHSGIVAGGENLNPRTSWGGIREAINGVLKKSKSKGKGKSKGKAKENGRED